MTWVVGGSYFRSWGNLLGLWFQRSRHKFSVVRKFCSVKCELVRSMCPCGYGYGCALDVAGWIPAFAGMTWVVGGSYFRSWGNLLGLWFQRSRHKFSVVREFCSVKCELVGSMCPCRVWLWLRVGRSGMDSRLRGNDVGGCGNGVGLWGWRGCRNDVDGWIYGIGAIHVLVNWGQSMPIQ